MRTPAETVSIRGEDQNLKTGAVKATIKTTSIYTDTGTHLYVELFRKLFTNL